MQTYILWKTINLVVAQLRLLIARVNSLWCFSCKGLRYGQWLLWPVNDLYSSMICEYSGVAKVVETHVCSELVFERALDHNYCKDYCKTSLIARRLRRPTAIAVAQGFPRVSYARLESSTTGLRPKNLDSYRADGLLAPIPSAWEVCTYCPDIIVLKYPTCFVGIHMHPQYAKMVLSAVSEHNLASLTESRLLFFATVVWSGKLRREDSSSAIMSQIAGRSWSNQLDTTAVQLLDCLAGVVYCRWCPSRRAVICIDLNGVSNCWLGTVQSTRAGQWLQSSCWVSQDKTRPKVSMDLISRWDLDCEDVLQSMLLYARKAVSPADLPFRTANCNSAHQPCSPPSSSLSALI